MSVLDLGVENVGDFYAEHYLTTVLDADLRTVLGAWERAERDARTATPWSRLRRLQRTFESLRSRAAELRDDVDRWRETHAFHRELLAALGYTVAPVAEPLGDHTVIPALVSWSRDDTPWLVVLEAPIAVGNDVDPMDARPLRAQLPDDAQELTLTERTWREVLDEALFARDEPEPPRWVIFLAGDEATLIDRWKWPQAACLRFDLARLLSVRTEEGLRALAALLHRDSLCPDAGAALHDTLDERSHKHAYAASEDLKHGARRAVELLANEVVAQLRARKEGVFNNPALASELTRDCLVYLYRLLFLFYVEARGAELGVVPANSEEYRRGYALESLRDLELVELTTDAARNGTYLHQSLQRLFKLVDEGFPRYREQLALTRDEGMIHHGFVVPGLRSALFDTARTAHIDRVPLRNHALQAVLACLSLTREGRGKERGRISYAQLGINQLGAVYEGLLSYSGFFAGDALYEVRAPGTHADPEARTWFVPETSVARFDAKTEVVRDPAGEPVRHAKGTFLYRLAGRDREKTASYYTPEVLTRCLAKYTLRERLAGLSAEAILGVTVCEPAMGSGAFLNEAVAQLADAYLAARQEELGRRIPSSEFEAERQRARFHFATGQVYGVDLNAMAAELGKVSLWLNVLGRGAPAPWFDARIATGNSLLGARREVFPVDLLRPAKGRKSGAWLDATPTPVPVGAPRPDDAVWHFLVPDPGMVPFDQDKVVKALAPDAIAAIKAWRKAQHAPFEMLDEARLVRLSDALDALFARHAADRDALLDATRQTVPLWGRDVPSTRVPSLIECDERRAKLDAPTAPGQRLRAVMDYWCSLWFWPVAEAAALPSRDAWLADLEALVAGREPDPARKAVVAAVTARMRFFHWELAFPEVFARGGFDVILGNPPWLKVEWDEGAVLADFDPTIALRDLSAKEAGARREAVLRDDTARRVFFEELESSVGTSWFLGAAQNYPLLQGAQNNLYKCFIERAMRLSPNGAIGIIHQKGLYDDPSSGKLRSALLPRLAWRFHFRNNLMLFESIEHQKHFELTVCGRAQEPPRFVMIANLFHPRAIEESIEHDGRGEVPGLKDEKDDWETRGHAARMVRHSTSLMSSAALLFGGETEDSTRLPIIHANAMLDVLRAVMRTKTLGKPGLAWATTHEWHEGYRQKDGTIRRQVEFPSRAEDLLVAGPHFYIGNPFNKTPNAVCNHSGEYTLLDPEEIPDDYLPRTLYISNVPLDQFYTWDTVWREKRLTQHYRHVHREMVSPNGERTLIPALMPPGPAQVDMVKVVACRTNRETVVFNGLASSLLVDFMIRAMGVGHVNVNLIERLPCEVPAAYEPWLLARVLRLNCLTVHYADLWAELFPLLRADDGFTKDDPRLPAWSQRPTWHRDVALRRAYARRQALVELDALAALALGVSMDDLALVYRVQFPVLQEYERDTWYDRAGRVVFTVNKGLPGVGLPRAEWDQVKDAKAGDALPAFAQRYAAPFDRCDRERDMRAAYTAFQGRVERERSEG